MIASKQYRKNIGSLARLIPRRKSANVEIVVQPYDNTKMRYENEKTSPITGKSGLGNQTKKCFPQIKITGCEGPVEIWVTSVQFDDEFNPHPNPMFRKSPNMNKENTTQGDGIAKYPIKDVRGNQGVVTFNDLAFYRKRNGETEYIEKKGCAYSENMQSSLKQPGQKNNYKNTIDTTQFKLCYQVFSKSMVNGVSQLKEIAIGFSNVIKDIQAHPELGICSISDNSSPIQGGKKIIILCNKIPVQKETKDGKNKIEIHFDASANYVADDKGPDLLKKVMVNHDDVHQQCAITITTPNFSQEFSSLNLLTQPDHFHVKLRMYKPSEQLYSAPFDFIYYNATLLECCNTTILHYTCSDETCGQCGINSEQDSGYSESNESLEEVLSVTEVIGTNDLDFMPPCNAPGDGAPGFTLLESSTEEKSSNLPIETSIILANLQIPNQEPNVGDEHLYPDLYDIIDGSIFYSISDLVHPINDFNNTEHETSNTRGTKRGRARQYPTNSQYLTTGEIVEPPKHIKDVVETNHTCVELNNLQISDLPALDIGTVLSEFKLIGQSIGVN